MVSLAAPNSCPICDAGLLQMSCINIRKIAHKCKVKRFFPTVSRRKILLVTFLLGFLGVPGVRAGETVLQVANWGGAEEVKLEEEIVQRFMQEHPGVRVEIETIPSGYREKILTRIAGGNPPDVFLLDS
ncbi:MAG TPA: extracellular solute-binding protein, partial [Bacteroidetes bacterium]|nr:extracellular solute-binding protein [Bacteroidota bacterium]